MYMYGRVSHRVDIPNDKCFAVYLSSGDITHHTGEKDLNLFLLCIECESVFMYITVEHFEYTYRRCDIIYRRDDEITLIKIGIEIGI